MDGILMLKAFTTALWAIQLACLVVILYCCWHLLNREVFTLVAASLTLLTTLYIERGLYDDGEV
jgi:hypothetical protein